ncbi:MAG: CotH kinase family protein [Ignavibacteriae bacterium]|nr:CotH kinase family protein [Ignavibacteriota bacterium]
MKIKITNIFILLIYVVNSVFGQTDESWKVYDDTEVAVINITMDSNDLQFMYDNPNFDSVHVANFNFKNAFIDETIDSIGISIRGNTSRESAKKSFKIEFNEFIKGRKFYSIEEMNLNGEHNDPSISRSKICWDFFNSIGLISSRASFAALYINGNYYGLYISVEHIDENFIKKNYADNSGNLWKCLYGADLNYINDNADSYKFGSSENRVYDLLTNSKDDNYTKLAEFIDFINNSDNETFKNQLPQKINILELLQYFAANVLLGSWDDYWSLTNNYYLYHESDNNIFHIIPYDYDNTFGISWSNTDWASVNPYTFEKVVNGYRPLIERTLQIEEFKNLFTHILEHFSKIKNNTSLEANYILELKNKINSFAENDTYRTNDYGFTFDDFNNSFFQKNFSKLHVKYSIQDFIDKRYSNLANQLNYVNSNPVIYSFDVYPKKMNSGDSIFINCSAFSNVGIKEIKAELKNLKTQQISTYDLRFSPDINLLDIKMNDLWKGSIGILPENFSGTIQISVEDNNGIIAKYPEDGIEIISAGENTNEVFLSELMSSNSQTIQDNFSEYEDWIEIYNPQDTVVNLSGKYLTDKIDNLTKWQFPENFVIQPKKNLLIWCDEDSSQGINHTNFKLSADGEFAAIVNNDGITIIDSVTFPTLNDDQTFARENNSGDWFVNFSATPGESNIITDLKETNILQHSYRLSAFPNPFNPSTKIEYEIAERSNVQIKIYDILGREVWSIPEVKKEIGNYNIIWNAVDNYGNKLSSGIYLLNINSNNFKKTIKLMLLQ